MATANPLSLGSMTIVLKLSKFGPHFTRFFIFPILWETLIYWPRLQEGLVKPPYTIFTPQLEKEFDDRGNELGPNLLKLYNILEQGNRSLREGFYPVTCESLVSREFSRIILKFHFLVSISRHFHFTFHSRSRFQGLFISLFILDLDFKAFSFHFSFSK